MRIRHVKIENFRGIKALDWCINARTVCLVGPNNATKSTILEAAEFALTPRWNRAFSDADFYNGSAKDPIKISLTVGELPTSIKPQQKFGGYLRGWNTSKGLVDEPGPDDEECLTVQLTVDSTLKPVWRVVNDRLESNELEIRISASDREKLGVSKVGAYVDRDLSWAKGATLARMTENIKEINFAEINRTIAGAITDTKFSQLESAAAEVQKLSIPFGVRPNSSFRPSINVDSAIVSSGTLSLHDMAVPLKQYGQGSKRLVSLAMQQALSEHGTILLIDELEQALEPHLLRRLVQRLRHDVAPVDEESSRLGQVFFTTHSPVVIVECMAKDLHIVRNNAGHISVRQVSDDFQAIVRTYAEALLSPKIVVCEGKTELGLLRGMDESWSEDVNSGGMAYRGVFPVEGGGMPQTEQRAIQLRMLGYNVLVFVDGDKPVNRSTLQSAGIDSVVWDNNAKIEQRIFEDPPVDTVMEILHYANSENKSFCDEILKQYADLDSLYSSLKDSSTASETRAFLADIANKHSVFKRIDHGEFLGRTIWRAIDSMRGTDLHTKTSILRKWIHSHE